MIEGKTEISKEDIEQIDYGLRNGSRLIHLKSGEIINPSNACIITKIIKDNYVPHAFPRQPEYTPKNEHTELPPPNQTEKAWNGWSNIELEEPLKYVGDTELPPPNQGEIVTKP